MNCRKLFNAIERQQSDELELQQTTEGRISELLNTLITIREENTNYKLQLRESELLKASFQQQKWTPPSCVYTLCLFCRS